MATYLFVIGEFEYSKAQKSKVKTVAKYVVKYEVQSSDWNVLNTESKWSMHLDRSSPDYCLLFYIWQSFCDIYSDNLTWLGLSFVLEKDRWLSVGNQWCLMLQHWGQSISMGTYSQWDCLDESFMMQSKANAHNHQFLRYKRFGVLWLLIGWSLSRFLRCRGLPSIIGKVLLRAFQCNLDR